MCTNKSTMGRTLNIWQKAFRVSVVHRCSGGAEGEEGRGAPGESSPTCHRCSRERCCSGQKPYARGTGYSCSTFPNHLLQRLISSPKTQPRNLCWRWFVLVNTSLHLHRAGFYYNNSFHGKGFTFNYTILRLYIVLWPLNVIKYRCSQSLMSV